MSTQSYVSSASWSRNRDSTRHRAATMALGSVSSSILFTVILGVLGLLYLTQITKTSVYGYQISELNDRKEFLVEENQTLKVESARLQALERIRSSKVASTLESESERDFVSTN